MKPENMEAEEEEIVIRAFTDYLGRDPILVDFIECSYEKLGNFSQLIFKGELVGYYLHDEKEFRPRKRPKN